MDRFTAFAPFSLIQPGDCLLYFADCSPVDWAIALKTWNKVAHVETYVGRGLSVAARNGLTVNLYPFRQDGLAVIRRPNQPFDLDKAFAWFDVPFDPVKRNGIRGQGYDWKGLLCFTLAVAQGSPDRMFCSEFCTRFYEHGGLDVFAPDYDADKIAPAQFLQTAKLTTVWKSEMSLQTSIVRACRTLPAESRGTVSILGDEGNQPNRKG
jgi:hypothetical protein